jgi:hypothetical protein
MGGILRWGDVVSQPRLSRAAYRDFKGLGGVLPQLSRGLKAHGTSPAKDGKNERFVDCLEANFPLARG